MDEPRTANAPPPVRPRHRVRRPLWLKLGVTFGALTAAGISVSGWLDLRDELARMDAEVQAKLRAVGQAAAQMTDGDELASFKRSSDMDRPEYRRMAERLARYMTASQVDWIGIYGRRDGRYHFLVDGDLDNTLPVSFPVFDRWPAMVRAFGGETTYEAALVDELGRWDSVFVPVEDSGGEVSGVIAVQMVSDWRRLVERRKKLRVLGTLALVAALVFLVSVLFARYLSRHIMRLAEQAEAVAAGDLDQHPVEETRDEIGLLARTFATMLRGLRERDFIRDAFGRYVTPEVVRTVLTDPSALEPGGRLKTVTILMSDLRGFTGLSERLPPAEMVELLNEYLGRMADVVEESGGTVLEFIGDAVLAVFGAPVAREDHAIRAVACAARMQVALKELNGELVTRGVPELEMGIGVNTGTVIVGNVGSARRMKYGVVGDAVNVAARVESFTVGGEVLITEASREAATAELTLRGPIEVRAKGKREPMLLFAVVSVGEPYGVAVPAEQPDERTLNHVMLLVEAQRVVGKEVPEALLRGSIIRMSMDSAELVVEEELSVFDNLRLRILTDAGGPPLEDIYAKVVRSFADEDGHRYRVRFTSVPEAAREGLASLVG